MWPNGLKLRILRKVPEPHTMIARHTAPAPANENFVNTSKKLLKNSYFHISLFLSTSLKLPIRKFLLVLILFFNYI